MLDFIMNFVLSIIILSIFLIVNHIKRIENKELVKLNEKLKLHRGYLEELFKNSQDGIAILDSNDRIETVNEAFLRIFRYERDEIQGLFINDVIANIEMKDALEFSNIIMHGGTVNLDTKRVRKDGSLIDVNVFAFPVILDTNQFGMCAMYRDITYKKKSEKELQVQRVYFSQLFENSPEAICIIDTEDRFIDVNSAFETLFGYTKEEVKNYHINDRIVQPGSIEEATQISKEVMNGNVIEHETVRMRKDRSLFDVRIVGYPIFFQNKQIGVFGIYKDITERKRLDETVKTSEYIFRTLFESSSDAVLIWEDNEENKVIDCNQAAVELLGYDSKLSILGKSPHHFSPEKQPDGKNSREKVVEMFKKANKSGKFKFEWWYEKIDGTSLPVEVMMTTVLLNGKKVFHSLWRDISERKQMEQKLEYLSYHDQLTGLYNRRFFEEELCRLDDEISLPLTIIMADVNGLKLINDSFGHTMGDELLKKVVEVIVKGCRPGDIVARLAGDEFVILLPKTDIYEAEQIVERIKALASKERVESVDISISFGYATKNNKEEKIQDIFKKSEDHMYKKKLFESPSMRGKTVSTIISTLHEKNKREEQHSYRVSNLCESMGRYLGLPQDEIKELKIVGLLHDIGKIAIDENILNKKGKLTEEEWEQIKRHPEIGYRILSTVNDMSEMSEYVLAHHEMWSGKGYPKGLKGEEIPLQSRIITIADSYDAMISERSYRSALPEEVAIDELKAKAGIQFDPNLIRVFIEKVLNKPFDSDNGKYENKGVV